MLVTFLLCKPNYKVTTFCFISSYYFRGGEILQKMYTKAINQFFLHLLIK